MSRTYKGRPIGRQLRRLRRTKGMSQKQVSGHSGIEPSLLCKYEAGTHIPNLPNLRRLAATLEVTTDQLLADAGASPPARPPRSAAAPV